MNSNGFESIVVFLIFIVNTKAANIMNNPMERFIQIVEEGTANRKVRNLYGVNCCELRSVRPQRLVTWHVDTRICHTAMSKSEMCKTTISPSSLLSGSFDKVRVDLFHVGYAYSE